MIHLNSQFVPSRPHCPNCNALLDGATGVNEGRDGRFTPGAITVCVYCAAVLIVTEKLQLRLAKPDDLPPPGAPERRMLDLLVEHYRRDLS